MTRRTEARPIASIEYQIKKICGGDFELTRKKTCVELDTLWKGDMGPGPHISGEDALVSLSRELAAQVLRRSIAHLLADDLAMSLSRVVTTKGLILTLEDLARLLVRHLILLAKRHSFEFALYLPNRSMTFAFKALGKEGEDLARQVKEALYSVANIFEYSRPLSLGNFLDEVWYEETQLGQDLGEGPSSAQICAGQVQAEPVDE